MISHDSLVVARWLLTALCLVAAIWWAIEGVRRLLTRRPVLATVIDRTYTDSQQLFDRQMHPWDRITNFDADGIQAIVPDILRVRYVVDGQEYRQDVDTAHMRGERADSTRIVWYDPQDPSRLLRNGPGLSFSCSLAALVFAATILEFI